VTKQILAQRLLRHSTKHKNDSKQTNKQSTAHVEPQGIILLT